ncbi:MAG: hypothetical protein JW943_16990 [Deltaproteobacteria bacterium]|nr:hypothetical protein [Deltaproteobacteria bacterium]
MKLKQLGVIFLLGVCVLLGCNTSDDPVHVSVTQVTFVDNGAVVPNPVVTTVTIKPDSIEYARSQSGAVIEQWSKQIESSDFDSLRQPIDVYGLFESADVTLAEGQFPMVGWRGMTITISRTDGSHTITISGSVSRTQWPQGIQELVNIKDELLEKYQ